MRRLLLAPLCLCLCLATAGCADSPADPSPPRVTQTFLLKADGPLTSTQRMALGRASLAVERIASKATTAREFDASLTALVATLQDPERRFALGVGSARMIQHYLLPNGVTEEEQSLLSRYTQLAVDNDARNLDVLGPALRALEGVWSEERLATTVEVVLDQPMARAGKQEIPRAPEVLPVPAQARVETSMTQERLEYDRLLALRARLRPNGI